MSSRAARKLQKLRQQQLASEQEQEKSESESEEERSSRAHNVFDLLNGDEEDEDEEEHYAEENKNAEDSEPEPEPELAPEPPRPKPKKSSKKKKKGGKNKVPAKPEGNSRDVDEIDDIDRALQELTTENGSHIQPVSPFSKTTDELLATDPKALNLNNEMRRLFGNTTLANDEPNPAAADLSAFFSGKRCPASQGKTLAGVKYRRNPLIPPKDDWPKASSGGLGMEVVPDAHQRSDVTVYKLVRNAEYQSVQHEFNICVESMDSQALINILLWNPYHVSTLIQASEFAKHQTDHAVSADLLERALFTIGRSAHHTFGSALMSGKARLSFLETQNREVWLAGWKYIQDLGMKGTWRTAYEWSKLLLSLNDSDPYCIKLTIDQLALRGREYAHFIDLCTNTLFGEAWEHLPNIQCSLALAYMRLNKTEECRKQLAHAITRFPWIFNKLAQELDLQPVPKYIWGKMPPDDSHDLLAALYIARAKDLWNTPESMALIKEVGNTLAKVSSETQFMPITIDLDIARHVIVSDIQSVTTHLPRSFFASRNISASDPFPPENSEDTLYACGDEAHTEGPGLIAPDRAINAAPLMDRNLQERLNHVFDDQLIFLANDGISILQDFVRVNGIDRGNWDAADVAPVWYYLKVFMDAPAYMQGMILEMMRSRPDCGELYVALVKDEMEAFLETSSYLVNEGLEELIQFIQRNGVDSGKWEDPAPIAEYIKQMAKLPYASQRDLLRVISARGSEYSLAVEAELQKFSLAVEGELERMREEEERV